MLTFMRSPRPIIARLGQLSQARRNDSTNEAAPNTFLRAGRAFYVRVKFRQTGYSEVEPAQPCKPPSRRASEPLRCPVRIPLKYAAHPGFKILLFSEFSQSR